MNLTPLPPRRSRVAPGPLVISVVVPLFNEANIVDRLVGELVGTLQSIGEPFEILLVDDGSSDATWERIQAAHRREPAIKGLSLMRNFGHQRALLAGLAHASGRAVVSMDGDLQHPPQLLPELIAAWRRGHKVVHTARLDSEDTGWLKRWTSRAFYRVFSALSGFALPPGSSDFRLLDAEVLATVLRLRDPEPFLRGIVHWLGCPSTTLVYRARPRCDGRSKFGFGRMLKLSVNGLVSFTTVPLRLGIWAGLATGALAVAAVAYIVSQLARGNAVPGWVSASTVVSFLFAVLFLLLGVLGTYLASIHDAVRNRPPFVVGRRLGADERSERKEPCLA